MPIKNDGQQVSFWTKNPLAEGEVTALWLEGYAATEIIGMLGLPITRNALIGKMNRMGYVGHVRGSKAPPKPKEKKPPALRQQRKAYRLPKPINVEKSDDILLLGVDSIRDIPIEDVITAVSLYDSKPHHCRWPVGHLLFCGARIKSKSQLSYCPTHHERSTTKSRGPYNGNKFYHSKYR